MYGRLEYSRILIYFLATNNIIIYTVILDEIINKLPFTYHKNPSVVEKYVIKKYSNIFIE